MNDFLTSFAQIYYEIISPLASAKIELFNTLCTDANKLLPEADVRLFIHDIITICGI